MLPAATAAFCSWSAVTTSVASSPCWESLIGLIQMRMAYWRWPKMMTCETPGTRLRLLVMFSWA